MFWFNKLFDKIDTSEQLIINDSKTPSGRVHVGALRGVLIHDAVYRLLRERGVSVKYLFGVDDYDPLDELPAGMGHFYEPYLGMPLCNVPAPPGSQATDMADHYISEFFDIFRELGVDARTYRMRDIYREGRFNDSIDVILRHADVVRRVYKEIGFSEKPEDWYPYQVICENCGRLGTTEVVSYDGQEVAYRCRADLVTWATGCGHEGRLSPFNGNGKLPWKLEWVAKWHTFPVGIEGAGKDHNTKGGSRDVAVHCLKQIFNGTPPVNIPYEFFLMGGAKMSSSRGVGATAREMADFLPPEILRFLMLRTPPNRTVDFSLEEEFMVKLFNDFDRLHWRTFNDPRLKEEEKQVYRISLVKPEGDYYAANFQLVLALVQMPHLDVAEEIEKRKGAPLSEIERDHLNRRIHAARFWLDQYADEEEKLRLQESLPERAHLLSHTQRAFLNRLADSLHTVQWEDEALQSHLFEVARLTPIDAAKAFQSLYRVLLDRDSGPKAGNLLAFLDRAFVIGRLRELPYSKAGFWRETGITVEEFERYLQAEGDKITSVRVMLHLFAAELDLPPGDMGSRMLAGLGVMDCNVSMNTGRSILKRVIYRQVKGIDLPFDNESDHFQVHTSDYIQRLNALYAFDVTLEGMRSVCEQLA